MSQTAPKRPPPLPAAQRQKLDDLREVIWFGEEDTAKAERAASESLAACVAEALGLKPFPVVAQKVMSLLSDPDCALSKITSAIEKDPALAIKLLQVTNSSLYRGTTATTTIDNAVVRLGRKTVSDVVAGVAAIGMFADSKGVGATIRDHSARVAAIARVLSSEWKYRHVENVFLAGLLHDVGKLLLIQARDLKYSQIEPSALLNADEVHLHERNILGFDHAILGANVLTAWKLPEAIASIVGLHHQPGRAYKKESGVGIPVALLRIADKIEFQLRRDTNLDEAYVRLLASDGDCEYAEYTADILIAMWQKFAEAAAEIQTLIK